MLYFWIPKQLNGKVKIMSRQCFSLADESIGAKRGQRPQPPPGTAIASKHAPPPPPPMSAIWGQSPKPKSGSASFTALIKFVKKIRRKRISQGWAPHSYWYKNVIEYSSIIIHIPICFITNYKGRFIRVSYNEYVKF